MPGENRTLTPVWIAYVDGVRLGTGYEGALKRIYIHDRLDSAGTASLLFGSSPLDFCNDGTFTIGSEVSIHLGYKDDVHEVFAGEVTGFAPRLDEYSAPLMEVKMHSKLHRLNKGTRCASFEHKTPAGIIRDIVQGYNLNADVEEFGPEYNYIEQKNLTDYGYIMYLAGKYGKTVYCHGNTVHVKTEITPTDDDVILERGKSIISARTRTSIAKQLSAAACTGWSIMDCRGFAATATMKDIPLRIGGEYSWEDNSKGYDPKRTEQITTEEILDEEDAAAVAKAYIQNRSFKFQSCDIKTQGNYRIKPGNRLTVKYIGKQSDGEYLVYSVEHDFSVQDGYFTTCHLKRNFCGVSNNRSISAIDRERIDRQSANAQGENAASTSASGIHEETHNNSENTSIEKNSQTSSEENSQADNNNPIVADNNEEILYDFGKVNEMYRNWNQQDAAWKALLLSNDENDTMSLHGCKIVAAAKLVCSVSNNSEFSPKRFVDKNDRIIDKNGNLSQTEIMTAIKKANPNIVVKADYFEKQLNESTLKRLKKDSEYEHYILGRANVGGGLGQHWVVIEDYKVLPNGTIEYKIVPSSKNDSGRVFTSDPKFATDKKKACINKIEVYSIKRN